MADRKVSIDIPQGNCTLGTTTREGLPEVISVNSPLRGFKHKKIFPWYLSVLIDAKEVHANGLPTTAENEAALSEFGAEIESGIASGITQYGAQNALSVARSTWKGSKELVYAVHDPDVAHAALQALLEGREWSRPWSYEMEHDPKWGNANLLLKLFKGTPRRAT